MKVLSMMSKRSNMCAAMPLPSIAAGGSGNSFSAFRSRRVLSGDRPASAGSIPLRALSPERSRNLAARHIGSLISAARLSPGDSRSVLDPPAPLRALDGLRCRASPRSGQDSVSGWNVGEVRRFGTVPHHGGRAIGFRRAQPVRARSHFAAGRCCIGSDAKLETPCVA